MQKTTASNCKMKRLIHWIQTHGCECTDRLENWPRLTPHKQSCMQMHQTVIQMPWRCELTGGSRSERWRSRCTAGEPDETPPLPPPALRAASARSGCAGREVTEESSSQKIWFIKDFNHGLFMKVCKTVSGSIFFCSTLSTHVSFQTRNTFVHLIFDEIWELSA